MVSGEQLIFDFFRTINTNFDFENFLVGSKNLEVFSVLKSWSSGRGSKIIYLWGESSVGKTHLLHSALKMVSERSIYIPLKEVEGLEPSLFSGLAEVGVLALDDVDSISGKIEFEESLFNLFNLVVSNGARLILSAKDHPYRQGFVLKDLISRLNSHSVYKLWKLADLEKEKALGMIATRMGIKADDLVWAYILRKSRRDMASLVDLLKDLDEYSLKHNRLLTVPFVRDFLNSDDFK